MKQIIKNIILKSKTKHLIIKRGCTISASSSFEGFNIINDGSLFDGQMGSHSYIGRKCELLRIKIGRFCSIGSNVRSLIGVHPTNTFVSTSPSFYSTGRQNGDSFVAKNKFEEIKKVNGSSFSVVVGNDVWIGDGVIIAPGITIGDGAIVGSGAVVTKDVDPYSIVVGVPAKVIKYRFSNEQIEKLLQIKWWDKDIKWIKEKVDLFDDIDHFLNEFINNE